MLAGKRVAGYGTCGKKPHPRSGLGRAGCGRQQGSSPSTMASIWVAFLSFCCESFLRLRLLSEVRVLPLGMVWISKNLAILGWVLACPFFSGLAELSGVPWRLWWDASGRWWWLGGMGLYRVLSGGLVLESISISSSWARRAASCTRQRVRVKLGKSQAGATQLHLAYLTPPGLSRPPGSSLPPSSDVCQHHRSLREARRTIT